MKETPSLQPPRSPGQFSRRKTSPERPVIALAGNPNTGKSTLFNALTGLKQHTGNWPGKTVLLARGTCTHRGRRLLLVDLPGTYSLLANSAEEEVARDFICFARPDATIVVTDATCLERNLNLVLQVLEITPRVVVCVNLMDEAHRQGISIDLKTLGEELGVPAVGTSAKNGTGLKELLDTVAAVATGRLVTHPRTVSYRPEVEAAARSLADRLKGEISPYLEPRWVALRLLDGDQSLLKSIQRYLSPFMPDREGVITSQ
jgi:Fe2+ transport system protein B